MLSKIAVFGAIMILALIFQTFFANLISIAKVAPDIFVILVVYLTLSQRLAYGAGFGFAAGLIESSTDPQLFGVGAVLKVGLALLVYFSSLRLSLESYFTRVMVVLISVVVHNVIYFLVAFGLGRLDLILYTSLKYALLSAIYSAAVAIILIYLSERKLTLRFEA